MVEFLATIVSSPPLKLTSGGDDGHCSGVSGGGGGTGAGAGSGAGWTAAALALCGFFRGVVCAAAVAVTESKTNINSRTLRDISQLMCYLMRF
jgi:hypothetical protein